MKKKGGEQTVGKLSKLVIYAVHRSGMEGVGYRK